jgi:hypothetical protein
VCDVFISIIIVFAHWYVTILLILNINVAMWRMYLLVCVFACAMYFIIDMMYLRGSRCICVCIVFAMCDVFVCVLYLRDV